MILQVEPFFPFLVSKIVAYRWKANINISEEGSPNLFVSPHCCVFSGVKVSLCTISYTLVLLMHTALVLCCRETAMYIQFVLHNNIMAASKKEIIETAFDYHCSRNKSYNKIRILLNASIFNLV